MKTLDGYEAKESGVTMYSALRSTIESPTPSPGQQIARARGARGGAGHYRAVLVSDRFEGLSRVKRQQLVYGLLADEMGPEIHALSMRTLTPEEWASEG